jgi:hypothetical protein
MTPRDLLAERAGRRLLDPLPLAVSRPLVLMRLGYRSATQVPRERLEGCATSWIFAATTGDAVERRATTLSDAGEMTRSLLSDAYGSAAAIALGLALEEAVARECAPLGLQPTKRTAPGYGDFELEMQRPLVDLVEARGIGITVTEDFLMLPAKTISGVIGGRAVA